MQRVVVIHYRRFGTTYWSHLKDKDEEKPVMPIDLEDGWDPQPVWTQI
jgi:hypothetical protein